jgi:hypothetical protein
MAASLNLDAAQLGVIALQAGTPEALTAVMDKWLDEHFGTEVLSIEMQVIANGSLTVMIVYRRDRATRR